MDSLAQVGCTAADLAARVRAGAVTATSVTQEHLAWHAQSGDSYGAFEHVAAASALRQAARIDGLPVAARQELPLAGVPIAIKDNVRVAGMPMRLGSRATPDNPSLEDHPVVARLRAAGAVIVGITRVPELCLWGTSDNAFGTARSPWAPDRTAGGSSGGSAAAVASALVPIAHGNDGLGSVRIPAACCGLVGIKPGVGVVPSALGANSWYGLAENGALGTTVADVALMLSVMAADAALASVAPLSRPLRIALAVRPPAPGIRAAAHVVQRTRDVAAALERLGHVVEEVPPPMPSLRIAAALVGTWAAGARDEVELLRATAPCAVDQLEARTRRHARAGILARRLGLDDEQHRLAWRATMDAFLQRYDVMMTPTLAASPLRAVDWRRRGWLANLVANMRVAPYCGPINFARLPAIALPAGTHADGTPASVHFVSRSGGESLLLSLAAQVEQARPWTRFSPRISHALEVMRGTRA